MLYFSPWKTVLIWLTVLAGLIFVSPNLMSQSTRDALPDFLPNQPITLGLDLQGGSHILLQLDRDQLLQERLDTLRDDARSLLRTERVGYTGLTVRDKSVELTLRETGDLGTAQDALSSLAEPVVSGVFGAGAINEVDLSITPEGLITLELTDAGIEYRLASALSQSIEVVSRRVNELGTTEPSIQRQGTDRILVQVPGLDDPERLKDILGRTAKLTFQFVDRSMPAEEALSTRPPAGTTVKFTTDDPPIPYVIENRVIVAGENLADSTAGFDQRTSEPIVSFRFDTKGAQRFGQATQQNVGREFAIVLDNQVISAPVIREPILGGSGQISGSFSVDAANDLAVLLRAGALPADLTVIEERTVGPGLGADSVAAGETAGIIGAILVLAFMAMAYGFLGIVANIALIANIVLLFGILTAIGATLTLPGIAGIVLTVGMAVDSNVLIFERVREEKRAGRSLIQAFDAGFSRAFTTIIDANVTTLIAAIILFYLGSGPIRGFAVTLAIGIVTTVFTAFTMTRWLSAEWIRRKRPKDLPKGLLNRIPQDSVIKFMKIRRITFMGSVIAALGALVLFATVNMNYGIDFKGGSLIEVRSIEGEADVSGIRDELSQLNLGDVQVQSFGTPQDVLIRIESQGGGENAEQSALAKVRAGLEEAYDFRRVEVVGPTVSGELAQAGTIAVLASLFAILIYIWLRFEWQFAAGAIIATLHDVVLTIGFFVISGIEFNLSSIAAILTIVGYSLNDTVVVYDRIRENLRRYKKMPITDLINRSMNEMLPRTILTSVTTMLALLALFIFGGEVIRSFTAAMLFGVAIGTYSSIYIAGPVLIMFQLRASGVTAEVGSATDTKADDQTLVSDKT